MDDQRQIEAVLAGDREAFSPLMDRYYSMVYRVCLNMAGNAPDAEELAHDSFVEAYLKLGQLRDASRFPGWLKTLTLNVCRMWYRTNSQRFVELDDEQVAAIEEEPEDNSIRIRMSHGLSALSAPHRLILVLHYYEELSYDEIATFLEISKGTVMSRLHRARQSLKEVIEEMTEYQDIPAVPDDRFKEVVQAEISVLLKMFHNEPNALERLTIVLKKSVERLVELTANAEDPAAIYNLAVLLPHLGAEAIDIVLDCCFSGREPGATKALELMKDYASRCGTIGHRDGMPDMPSRDTYAVLDRVIVHKADDRSKARLLLEMMESSRHSCPAVLFINALLCYREAAFPMLVERFDSSTSPWVLQSLVRTGPLFGQKLLEMLRTADESRQMLALTGFESVARSLCPSWAEGESRKQYLNDLRTRDKWPPVKVEDLGAELLENLTTATAELAAGGSNALRAQALRVLGYLRAGEQSAVIADALQSDDATVRLAAIFALSEIGDPSSADALIERAREGDASEKAAAAAALGRMQVARAEHLLVEMTGSSEAQVREAAAAALGEMGTVSSRVVLQELMKGGDRRLQKIAAKAVFGGVKKRKHEPSEVDRRLAEKRRKVAPITLISPDAALRFGLTELRSYDEQDVTDRIAEVCLDYCATRRYVVEFGLMSRSGGVYEFTESGKSAWRVEQFVCERYLGCGN